MTALTTKSILDVLATIPDPEMPISIVDLGLVEKVDLAGDTVQVTVLPTFVGCPALPMIEEDIRAKLATLDGIERVDVRFVNDPPWSVDRISDAGRSSLREHGVTVPAPGSCAAPAASRDDPGVELRTSAIPCPFCDSRNTRLDSPFGPTRCRMIYYCDECRNSFEHLKRV